MRKPSVAVVTPVFNGENWIEDTVSSVLRQSAVRSGRADLRYIVMDGASTDATVKKVEALAGDRVQIHSAKDKSMYDALARGFGLVASGSDVCAYLNAGDLWHERALDIVLDVMSSPDANWICGYQVALNKKGDIVHLRLPFRFRSRLIACGSYLNILPPIQQESTFWRTELLETVDLERLATFRFAGDNYLWYCFSQTSVLCTVSSILGGFRVHGDHLSGARQEYAEEMTSFIQQPSWIDRIVRSVDRFIWQCPDTLKKALGRGQILRYDLSEEKWR